jgi:hypothetical protein
MPIYPPRNTATKKKQILDYKIFEFLKCVELNESIEKLEKKAEEVRGAMLKLIKARLVLTKSYKSDDNTEANTQLSEKLYFDMKNWDSFTFDEIMIFCVKH